MPESKDVIEKADVTGLQETSRQASRILLSFSSSLLFDGRQCLRLLDPILSVPAQTFPRDAQPETVEIRIKLLHVIFLNAKCFWDGNWSLSNRYWINYSSFVLS
jgi:hypothetical protein